MILLFSKDNDFHEALWGSLIALYKSEFGDYGEQQKGLVENPEKWRDSLSQQSPYRVAVLVEISVDRPDHAIGFLVAEFFDKSQCGLLTYCAVQEASRNKGVAKGLIAHAREWLGDQAQDELLAIFTEFEIPDAGHPEFILQHKRQQILSKLGVIAFPQQYIQPSLGEGKPRGKGLHLGLVVERKTLSKSIDGALVAAFLQEFFEREEGRPQDIEFLTMLHEWKKSEIEIIEPQPLLDINQCALSYQFESPVNRQTHRLKSPPPENPFDSFQLDLLSYAYCDSPPFETHSLSESGALIEICLDEQVAYQIEGVTYILRLPAKKIRATIHIHATHFRRSKKEVLHLVLTPQEELNEYDILRLTSLWSGVGAFEKIAAGKPWFIGSRPDNKRQYFDDPGKLCGFLPEFQTASYFDVPTLGQPIGGTLQVSLPEKNGGCGFGEIGKALDTFIRKHDTEEVGIDPDKLVVTDEEVRILKILGGFAVNILDFENVDTNELADTLQRKRTYRDPSKIVVIHRGSLVYVSGKDRNLDERKDDIGISPYLLIPQAVLLHNELVLRKAVTGEPNVHEMSTAELEARLDGVSQAVNTHFVRNSFQYPTERWIYEKGSAIRGMFDLREQLLGDLDRLGEMVAQKYEERKRKWDTLLAILATFISLVQTEEHIVKMLEYLSKGSGNYSILAILSLTAGIVVMARRLRII